MIEMQILDYIIPKKLQTNHFIVSIYKQSQTKELSVRQIQALEKILDITDDIFIEDMTCKLDYYQEDFDKLKTKLLNNRFKQAKNRDKCLKAIKSIADGEPDQILIDNILRPYPFRRWHRHY